MRTKEEIIETAKDNNTHYAEVQVEVLIDIRDCLLELIKVIKENK